MKKREQNLMFSLFCWCIHFRSPVAVTASQGTTFLHEKRDLPVCGRASPYFLAKENRGQKPSVFFWCTL